MIKNNIMVILLYDFKVNLIETVIKDFISRGGKLVELAEPDSPPLFGK